MIWLLCFLIVIFFITAYLLSAPFYIEINSRTGLYQIRFHYVARVKFIAADSSLIIDIYVAGWHKRIDILKSMVAAKNKKKKTAVKKYSKKRKIRVSWRGIWRVFKSFKINKCHITLDAGDMATDGLLYPLFYGLRIWKRKDVSINFKGENEVILEIENNFLRILSTYFNL